MANSMRLPSIADLSLERNAPQTQWLARRLHTYCPSKKSRAAKIVVFTLWQMPRAAHNISIFRDVDKQHQ